MPEPFVEQYLAARRHIAPPPEAADLWLALPRTEDFAPLESRERG
jgi:hypothetical protein